MEEEKCSFSRAIDLARVGQDGGNGFARLI
jgi:hypothetical protein